MNEVILSVDGRMVYQGSIDACKNEARKQGKANHDAKRFEIFTKAGTLLSACHYEHGKRLLWREPAR